jgi:hypothetical protein
MPEDYYTCGGVGLGNIFILLSIMIKRLLTTMVATSL